ILCDSFLFFGNFQSLDRNLQLTGLLVEGDDASVDLLTNRKALRTLFVTITRQIRTADEAVEVVIDQTNFQTTIGNSGYFAGYHGILAQFTRSCCFTDLVAGKLLDAERDAFLLNVNVENDCLNDFTLVVLFDDLFAWAVPVKIGKVNHTVDIAVEADEQTEFGLVLNF